MSKYPLASSSWDETEFEAIEQVVRSGMFTMGPRVASFEKAFADFLGSRFCVMVNSGSSANLLMVAALFFRQNHRLRAGDEVIVPAVSWSTTYSPLHQYGLKLKFVDIDPETLNYDLAKLRQAVSADTRLLMAVNLLGNPNDFQELTDIIAGRNIILIEDNCEALGAVYEGRQTGTFGLMGSFSTFFSHHISTMEGGVIATDDEELYHILLCLRAHGWTRDLPRHNRVTGTKGEDPFDESFRFVLPGYNVRPMELSGAIGLEQLKKLPRIIRVRRENAVLFQELLGDHPYFRTQRECGRSSWFGFSLLIDREAPFERRSVLEKLAEHGIEFRPIVAGNFTKNPVIQWFDYEISGNLENADLLDRNGFFVGNHHYPLDHELPFLAAILNDFRG